MKIEKQELDLRIKKFREQMNRSYPSWELACITSEMNLYYFTGTLQRGMLMIERNGSVIFWVRKSIERACAESNFEDIRAMPSFRTAVAAYVHLPNTLYLEKNTVTIQWLELFSKYFSFHDFVGIDRLLQVVRAVKTDYEINLQKEAGKKHRILLEEKVPPMLRDGITEAELAAEIFLEAIKMGHQGLSRFSGNNGDMYMGYVAFSESGLNPTNFDGPGGTAGISPAAPVLGSNTRKLKKGDIVFVDFGIGIDGYSTDKTQLYSYGKEPANIVTETYEQCLSIMRKAVKKMIPGNIPSVIYEEIMNDIPEEFQYGFMGYKERTVKFLGHGVGLHIDEYPVIAKRFDEPFEKNMVLAVEPKRGIDGYGMIGVEETFLINEAEGANCLTANNTRLIVV